MMQQHAIQGLLVTDENDRLVGIISDRDLRRPDWVDEAPDLSYP